jgi:hypothetical protein
MTEKNEIKSCVIAGLETALDQYMVENSFRRSSSGLTYKRKLNGASQKVSILIEMHPKDDPNAAAAIYPQMEVLIPDVDEVLEEMVGPNLGLLEGITAGISRQPIGFISEKIHHGRWYLYQPDSVPGTVEDIRSFMERWTIPFLDRYATPEDVVAADEGKDGRLARDRAQMMRVVAASLVCGRRDYARGLMERHFGAPGARRRYQQVFEYIQQAV